MNNRNKHYITVLKQIGACASQPSPDNLQQLTHFIAVNPTAFFATDNEKEPTLFYHLLTQKIAHIFLAEKKIAGLSALLVAVDNAGFNPLTALVCSRDPAIKIKRNELLALKLQELAEAVKFGNIMPDRLAKYIFGFDEKKQMLSNAIQATRDSTLQDAFDSALSKIDTHLNTTVVSTLQDTFLQQLRKNLMAWESSQGFAERNANWIQHTSDASLATAYLYYLTNAPINKIPALHLSLTQAIVDSDKLPTQITAELTENEDKILLLQKEEAQRFPLYFALQLLALKSKSNNMPIPALQLTLYLITCLTNVPMLKWEALAGIHMAATDSFKLMKLLQQQQLFAPPPQPLRAQTAPAASGYYLPNNLLETVDEEEEKIEEALTTGNSQWLHKPNSRFSY